jgi:hypothetical protein
VLTSHLHARLRVHWPPGIPHALYSGRGETVLHNSGESRREIADSCVLNTNAPRFHLSSPGLTGRPSIPETPVMESNGSGVLDRPVKPDDDSSCGEANDETILHLRRRVLAMTVP